MKFLVRKISRQKWSKGVGGNDRGIGADAVTADLRTQGNRLSLWEIDDDGGCMRDLSDVVLALACNCDRLDRIDIAWVPRDSLEQLGLRLEPAPGNTAYRSFRDAHYDGVDVDLEKLVGIAREIAGSVRDYNRVKRFRKSEVREMLREAIQRGDISAEDLSNDLRSEFT